MRRLALGLVSAAVVPSAYATDTDAIVTVKELVVHAAPGETAPDTGVVPKGTRLQVHHEEPGGWLAVQPPNGSISWVNHRFLDFGETGMAKFPASATVRCGPDGIEIEAGRFTTTGPLGVRRTRLAPDTVVSVMGNRVQWPGDNSYWYPIWSTAGDFRYVRREGVQAAGQPTDRMVVLSSASAANPLAPAAVRPFDSIVSPGVPTTGDGFKPARPADWPNHPLWAQAETADKAGDWDRAEKYYFSLAAEMNKPGGDAELANLSYSRIHSIRERRRAKGGDAVAVRTTTSTVDPAVQPAAARVAAATTPGKEAKDAWYGPGTLYVAVGKYNGQVVCALESEPGRVVVYVLPAPGFDLQPYLRRKIAVQGKVIDPNYASNVPLVSVGAVDPVK